MELSAIAIHPVAPETQQPWPGQPSEAAPEQATGQVGGAPEPDRYRDTYEPASIPGNKSEADARSTTSVPEGGIAARENQPKASSERPPSAAERPGPHSAPKSGPGALELTPEEKAQVEELKARDAAVRAHEQAHVMAGGQYIIRRAEFDTVVGPDGKLYAVGGEVQIDTSEVPDDPEATIQKAQAVRRAALAPSDPSPADLRVAAAATRMEFEARMELARQRAEETQKQAEEYSQEGGITTPQPEPVLVNLFA
ncbi:MAG: hypothetical protein JSU77_04310 [Fidelibacterota bacterium]|nr:MAG: hypothetical protein JSU77_04310 [Candidatus Neomarinimicrobiota bacterium]